MPDPSTNRPEWCSMSAVVDQLLERARAETGLSDFGAGDWHDGLCRLVEAVEKDVGEDSGSIDRIESLLVARLCRRLRVEDWYAGHGAEARDAVSGPFVIFGLPRTGTTALHHMLSLDARFRYLRKWEVEAPVPPPDLATERSDVRRRQPATRPIPSTFGGWMDRLRTERSSRCASTTARWCSPSPPIRHGGEQPITEMPLPTTSASFAFSTLTGRPTIGC